MARAMLLWFGLWIGCGGAATADSDAGGGEPDSGSSTAQADAGVDAAALPISRTRIALNLDGVPTLTDDSASQLIPMAESSWQSFYAIDLSPSGREVAFCASDDNASIRPFAGAQGAITSLAATGRCKGARLGGDGSQLLFIEYGEGVSPPKKLRHLDSGGGGEVGDGLFGSSQLWTPHFVAGGTAAVMINPASGGAGPLIRVELATGDSRVLVEDDVDWEFDVGPGDQIAAALTGVLYLVDADSGDATRVLDLQERHPEWSMRTVEFPRWDAAGEHIAFMSRTGPGGLKTEVLVYDVIADQVIRLTDDERPDTYADIGAPDADGVQWVYWVRESNQLARKRADGTGDIEILIDGGVGGRFDVEIPADPS